MAVSKKPDKPSNVVLDRLTSDRDKFKVKWKKPTTKGDAAVSKQQVQWYWQKYTDASDHWRASGKAHTVAMGTHEHSHTFDSVDSSSTTIKRVKAVVTFSNSKGSASASEKMTLYAADAPSISMEASAGVLKAAISFPSDTDTKPLAGGSKSAAASWKITKQPKGGSVETVESRDKGASKAADRPLSGISGATLSPADGKAYKYTVSATIDGAVYYQDSKGAWKTDKTSTASRYVAKPNTPKIGKDGVTASGHSYTVTWTYDDEGGWRPADSFELFYADVAQGADAEAATSWTSIEDGLTAKSYTSTIAGAIPDGMRRFFMVKAYHYGIDSDYAPYGPNSMWGAPEPPTISANGDTITVTANNAQKYCPTAQIEVYREQAGKSALLERFSVKDKTTSVITDAGATSGDARRYYARTVNVGYGNRVSENAYTSAVVTPNETRFKTWAKDDDCETAFLTWERPSGNVSGYEVAWGETEDAFQSNKQPSTLTLDGAATTSCRISDLKPGEQYWFWVRTIGTADGVEYRSGWSNEGPDPNDPDRKDKATLIMANPPDEPGITLSSDFVIAGGDALTVGWTYSALGNAPQTSWTVTMTAGGVEVDKRTSSDEGATADDYSATFDTTNYPRGNVECTVYVENVNGGNSASTAFAVAVVPIVHDMNIDSTCTALPLLAWFVGDLFNPYDTAYSIEVENVRGIVQQLPNGERVQYDGQNVGTFSGAKPSDVGQSYAKLETNYISPELIDGGRYRARAVATDPSTGLTGYTDWAEFVVDWANKAEAPEITVDPSTDTATVTAPQSWPEGCTVSIWRATKDGVTLAVGEAKPGVSYFDQYAPFGDSHYRASIETPDGDVAFSDWAAGVTSQDIRFDFGGNFASMAYNITNNDTRDSGDDVKEFLDGSRSAITKAGTNRTHALSAVLIREEDSDRLAKFYALSRYDGVCFVRTPDGMAYPAVVSVGIDQSAESRLVNVSITCKEVDDEGQFLAEEVE